MSENRTLSIALPLETFQYGPDKSKTGFRAVDRHTGQKFVIFDAKVAEAIRSVGDQSRDYGVRAAQEAGRDAVIESVPGIYTPAPRFGGGGGGGGFRGGGGGGMSNKQVALLAASNLAPPGSQVAVVTAYAEKLLVWLVGGGETQAPAQAAPAPAAPQGWSAPAPAPAEVPENPAEQVGAFIEGIGGGDGGWN